MTDVPSPVQLKEAARMLMDIGDSVSEDEVSDRFTELAGEWHPDIDDREDASDRFKALNTARDILLDNVNLRDESTIATAENTLTDFISVNRLSDIDVPDPRSRGFASDPGERIDPTSVSRSDVSGVDPEERSEVMREVYLGVETLLVWQGTANLFDPDYTRQDFFRDLNGYIDNENPDDIQPSDYYNATSRGVRDDVTEENFVESIRTLELRLQDQYGSGASISEVARIISYFMVQGGFQIGPEGTVVGGNTFGGDPRFGRDSRFGRDNRFARGGGLTKGPDERFTEDDRFGR